MFNISQFLKKFESFGRQERFSKEMVCQSVKDVLGVNLDPKDVSIRNGEVFLQASAVIKNSVFMKKGAILKAIKEKGVENIENIR